MSYCKREGKDKSVFVTSKDAEEPALVKELVEEEGHGIILPNGEINWDCPCLGGMADGTCGKEFKEAFSCFHYSEEEEKGVDCIPQFRTMQECFLKYPKEYGKFNEEEEEQTAAEASETSLPKESGAPPPETADNAVASSPPDSGSRTGNELESNLGSSSLQARTS